MQRQLWLFAPPHPPSSARIRLLTYPMAFAQPQATVPLLHTGAGKTDGEKGAASASTSLHVRMRDTTREFHSPHADGSGVVNPRRWVRDPDELCVASMRRSKNMNKINTYVATYKFDDPQWAPLLLPQVTFRPRQHRAQEQQHRTHAGVEATDAAAFAPPNAPPPSSEGPSASLHGNSDGGCRVTIDHNKLLTLECMSRHVNFSLRHIVQKGHGVYLLHHAQHSLLRPKGIVEQSFVSCAFGIRGERLRTDIVHVGPLDAMDVLDLEEGPHGHIRGVFNFQKPDIPRGVIAVSQVEGYGTWFQRKPMLWQRSRRIGALQSQLGAFTYDLVPPQEVGKQRECEVSLLASHMRFFGNGTSGSEAVGIIASSQVAQQDRLYLGQFEAPAMTALDAVHQLAHASALRCRLVRPLRSHTEGAASERPGTEEEEEDDEELEKLVPLSWATRTPPPYVPLEADLPFKLQMSKPAVFGGEEQLEQQHGVYPTGGTVGSPFVRGAPIMLFEYNLHQGVDHYVFDDAPSARPMKWWSQKSNLPYSGYMYFARSGVIDQLSPSEDITNPLEPAAQRKPLHTLVPPTKKVQHRLRQYKQRLREETQREKATRAAPARSAAAAAAKDDGAGGGDGG
ncbi:hypothetical protein TraAM80_07859 [Trypanosoma rangeli]|uniref:Uncharacterized protein n=1 Tax=Trypanosoma rangeli TaxID=5698 RepID=A0A422N3L6_TRYRA|nr:uncharacterized protein TraAM80_07859 [Trypanosoma rangeli]RNF00041.1 hypothetical protein TraAM80_07859 [Trypanosoma rangeli]|eukprot:RNF00041.1 hypothetical protein TraAM80_07859 [Trypanosoma rangeli]